MYRLNVIECFQQNKRYIWVDLRQIMMDSHKMSYENPTFQIASLINFDEN